jgi:twitching motility two-component system response regulator PilH
MNVLICDDMETDRANLRKILTELGHIVQDVTNGEDAVSTATRTQPKVIFLDVVMPKMDGFATCRALKQKAETKNIPVVVVSSKGTPSDKFWAEKQGASAHVTKPATSQEIKAALQKLGVS